MELLTYYRDAVRRWLIRRLVRRMEICMNMTVVSGSLMYGGRHGGAICEQNRFIENFGQTD